jgi:hypothetical protein
MKAHILTILLTFTAAPLLLAQLATPDLDKLKQQFDAESAAALKPVVLRYAAQLEAARRAALQRGEARTAVAAEDALNELRSKTQIPFRCLPRPPLAVAPALHPPRRRLKNSGNEWATQNGKETTEVV